MFIGAGGSSQHMHRALWRALQQQQQQQQKAARRRPGVGGGGGNGAPGGASGGGNPSFRAPSPGGFAHAAAASSAVSAAAGGGPAAALAALLARGGGAAAGAAAAAGVRFAAAALIGGTTAAVALNSRADRRDVSTAAAAAAAAAGGGGTDPSSSSFAAAGGSSRSSSSSSSSSRGDAAVAGIWKRGGGGGGGGGGNGKDAAAAAARESDALPWVRELAAGPGVREVPLPGQMLRDHPIGRLVSEPDHLFANMVATGQMREFRCFYDEGRRLFHSVVLLGRDVAGYPSTLHGGATAAVVDETLGGLYTSLLAGGKLGATLPGLTKRLEVDYKRTAPTGGALLVTAEVESVEPRKVWMRASVRDGATGAEYATGRALFVAPHLGRMICRALGLPGQGGKASDLPSAAQGAAAQGAAAAAQGAAAANKGATSPLGGGKTEPPAEGGF